MMGGLLFARPMRDQNLVTMLDAFQVSRHVDSSSCYTLLIEQIWPASGRLDVCAGAAWRDFLVSGHPVGVGWVKMAIIQLLTSMCRCDSFCHPWHQHQSGRRVVGFHRCRVHDVRRPLRCRLHRCRAALLHLHWSCECNDSQHLQLLAICSGFASPPLCSKTKRPISRTTLPLGSARSAALAKSVFGLTTCYSQYLEASSSLLM